ncbi:hypothetical protein LCGC14_2574170, partial [marine sediment metagenome]
QGFGAIVMGLDSRKFEAVIEGHKPDAPPDEHGATIELADSPDGPWRPIAYRDILDHPQGWHFGIFGEGRLSGDGAIGYVRISAAKGLAGIRIAGHYVPANIPAAVGPLTVEHTWYEVHPDVGRRLHRHSETIAADSHEYVVHCDRTPHDESITLSVPSVEAK